MKEKEEMMAAIQECDAMECSFNQNKKCHAFAINVGGPNEICASCDTFFKTNVKGGLQNVSGGVGACKVQSCVYNKLLQCTAGSVRFSLHESHADCATYQPL
ncbi:MAG TPA: DUF1540 domain-containing protein [Chitinivibrionales bacterium]|nr:DUF1540 domain-containing protein [Chitinivibrionales bacterium]